LSETLAAEAAAPSRIDEEDVRLTTGFADIFTAIVLVVGGAGLAAMTGAFGCLLLVAAAFALGKPIVRVREFAAASSVLAFGAAFGAGTLGASIAGVPGILCAAAAAALHWRSFRVPLALALAWASLLCVLPASLLGASRASLALVLGIELLAAALVYDARDRLRRTRLADVAFWLHLGAAPLLVHGLFAAMGADPFGGVPARPVLVLTVFGGLTLVSLVIDRRPLLVSSFLYLLVAVGSLLSGSANITESADRFAAAALAPAVIGAFLLVLAAAWTPLRRAILWPLPQALKRFVPPPANRAPATPDPDEPPAAEKEPLRLVLGFNDIFVSAGSTMMFIGCGALAYFLTRSRIEAEPEGLRLFLSPLPVIWVGLPALSLWLVAEYFVRVRRMAWPAITTAVWFSLTSWVAGYLAALAYALRATPLGPTLRRLPSPRDMPPNLQPALVAIFCAVAVAANLAFWRRHRTPISFALAVASLLPLLVADRLFAGQALARSDVALRLVPAGLVVFALAMGWDRADRERRTQRSDTAFWLHLLAALLVIPPLFALTAGTPSGPLMVVGGFVLLVALAVTIDRRAPLVVALPVLIAALGGGAVASVVISLGLLALVLRWDRVRGWLLALAPPRASV
jgi:hypothetical protein